MYYLINNKGKVIFSDTSKIKVQSIKDLHGHSAKIINKWDFNIPKKQWERVRHIMAIHNRKSGFIDIVENRFTNKLEVYFFDSNPKINNDGAAEITIEDVQRAIYLSKK